MSIVKLVGRPMLPVLLLLVTAPSFAITLETYKTKVSDAHRLAVAVEESMRSKQADDSMMREFAARVRRDFPQSETVEWPGGTVETTNEWLLDHVRSVESETDGQKRLPKVIEIREYLSTIVFKIQELERSDTEAAGTKDADKRKLAEILRREEYQKPQEKEESLFQRWLRGFLEWLENLFPQPSGPTQNLAGLGVIASVLKALVYVGLLLLVLFLAYKIAQLFIPALAGKRKPKKKTKDRVILGEQLREDETASDLFGEAERLAREGNLRGAIRKGYIALLCDLSDRRVIGLARSKTNRDYLRDVRSRAELYPRMKVVTDTFERHWYGTRESAESDWSRFRDEYQDAIRSV